MVTIAPSRESVACTARRDDPHRLLDILHAAAAEGEGIPDACASAISKRVHRTTAEVMDAVRFFTRFSGWPCARTLVRVSGGLVSRMTGSERVLGALAQELGVLPGQVTPDGRLALCAVDDAGMSDQAPAVFVGDRVLPSVTPEGAREIARHLRLGAEAADLVRQLGDGNNAHPLVQSPVNNHVRYVGPAIFRPLRRGEAIRKALCLSPVEVMRVVKCARLRDRGMESLPTGLKWEFVRSATIERVETIWAEEAAAGRDYAREFERLSERDERFVICIACDAEPGSFRDRVILTELADRVFAGMTITGYAIGATLGLLYLRDEYAYLIPYLESVLRARLQDGLLGRDICGKQGFSFHIQIRHGAAPYVLGEETAITNACEGRAGRARPRPPFPTAVGYLGHPTAVDCAETLCCVTKIIDEGPASFCEYGTSESTGTKLLCVSGDCERPGVYEVPFGTSVRTALELAGAEQASAVLLSGPSPRLLPRTAFQERIAFEHLPTTGSLIVLGPGRDFAQAAVGYAHQLAAEQCGYCAPCREGLPRALALLDQLATGEGNSGDSEELMRVGQGLESSSMCVLGRAAGRFLQQCIHEHPAVFRNSHAKERLPQDPGASARVKARPPVDSTRSSHDS